MTTFCTVVRRGVPPDSEPIFRPEPEPKGAAQAHMLRLSAEWIEAGYELISMYYLDIMLCRGDDYVTFTVEVTP